VSDAAPTPEAQQLEAVADLVRLIAEVSAERDRYKHALERIAHRDGGQWEHPIMHARTARNALDAVSADQVTEVTP
jgi:hypothetical protein